MDNLASNLKLYELQFEITYKLSIFFPILNVVSKQVAKSFLEIE